MKQMQFAISLVFIVLGISIITISKTIEEIMPKLGYVAYQAAGGPYSTDSYSMDLRLNYWIGAICVLFGIIYWISNTDFIRNSIQEIKVKNEEFDEKNKNNHE